MVRITLTTLASCLLPTVLAADPAGLRFQTLDLPHHGDATDMVIWYPSAGGGTVSDFGANPVFQGVAAEKGADLAEGAHPVVLFSHGMGGTHRAQAWLASGLAQRGAIVVAVDHPNTTWRDFDMADGVEHWTRAADLSAALDALQADPDFAASIDPTRITAAGFSYGGWTALSLGGMTGNHAGIVEACTTHSTMSACDVLLSDDVRMQDLDQDTWNASYADPRVTHVAAIDPGFVWGIGAVQASDLVPDTLMIGFGDGADRMLATNFDASGMSAAIPAIETHQIAPAVHFTAMPVCTPAGAAILEEEQDDPVCTDPEGADRAAVHAEIIELIARQIDLD